MTSLARIKQHSTWQLEVVDAGLAEVMESNKA